jgi:putative ABC transport system permease protein
MIKSYATIAIRNFIKGFTFSIVNLFGLSIGLTSVLLILGYINYEFSFDKHYSNSNRVYQILIKSNTTAQARTSVLVPDALSPVLKDEFAEIEAITPLSFVEKTLNNNDHVPVTLHCATGRADFFTIFNFEFIVGNPAAFKSKQDIILTEDAAKKLFHNPISPGQILTEIGADGKVQHFKVSGIIKNIPANTHFKTDALIMAPESPDQDLNFEAYSATAQYIMLKKNIDITSISSKFETFFSNHGLKPGTKISFSPVTDIHLNSELLGSENLNIGNRSYIYILGCAALLILVIACMNYINLTTAQSLQRVTEIGIRRSLGGEKKHLIYQFMSESSLFFFLAFLLATLLSLVIWPVFTAKLGLNLSITHFFNLKNIVYFLIIGIVAGVLSGLHPALVLSTSPPVSILRGQNDPHLINLNLRKVLIIFQFSISVTLIIATVVIWQELRLLNNKDLGFNKTNLLVLPQIGIRFDPNAFRKILLDNPHITSVSFAGIDIGKGSGLKSSMPDSRDSSKMLQFAVVEGDLDLMKTLELKLKEGRNFSPEFASDLVNYDSLYQRAMSDPEKNRADIFPHKPILITESAAKALQLQSPVNSVLKRGAVQGTVIGVVKDFRITTLKEASPLLIYSYYPGGIYSSAFVRLSGTNMSSTIIYIEKAWEKFFPDLQFRYSFADQNLQKLYQSENSLMFLFIYFAVLAIVISSLGLFSILSLTVKQRNKEIGVRKVLGASETEILVLLTRDFIFFILSGIAIAIPVAFYLANQWLMDFDNRIEIHWSVFTLSAAAAAAIGFMSVAFQALASARLNPVNALKSS